MDFSPLGNPTGPHGVGCQRIWTKKNRNHVLVYYPISQQQWVTSITDVTKLLPYTLFGEKEALQQEKNNQWLLYSTVE